MRSRNSPGSNKPIAQFLVLTIGQRPYLLPRKSVKLITVDSSPKKVLSLQTSVWPESTENPIVRDESTVNAWAYQNYVRESYGRRP